MPLHEILLTKEDFENSKWEEIIEKYEEKECHSYSTAMFKKAREAEGAGDKKNQEIFDLLGSITSMYFKPYLPNDPFGPMVVMAGSRSAIVDDFSEDHLNILSEIVFSIKNAEIRCRIADVLWIRKRDFRFAETAIDTYLDSAKILEHPENWSASAQRIERAFRLALLLGPRTGKLDKVINHIERVIEKYEGKDPLFFTNSLMKLLIEVRRGDFQKYCDLSKEIAQEAEKIGNYYKARAYWETNVRWNKLNKDTENERIASIQIAETYAKEAENSIVTDSPSYFRAAFHQQKAIEAYRRIGGLKDKVNELHQILLYYQEKSMGEMKVISTKVDIGDFIKESTDKIKGKTLQEALIAFALIVRPPRIEELREQVKESANNHPIQHLVTSFSVNDKGKVVAKRSGMFSTDKNEVEASIRENMFRHASFYHSIDTQGIIEPIRNQINLEHNVRLDDFIDIVSNNPFVPRGREYIYAQGLQAGMEGDFVVAAHLLIPQIENSIRNILSQMGVLTSGIDSDGIQDERSLNVTLYILEIKEVFGEDIVFDLQGLLVERPGANLRNRMAHGLMTHESFYSVEVPYLWALVLRICCLFIIKQRSIEEERCNENTENVKQEEGGG
ncbi:MAG: DUF4209 domain-containing protein [Deltaproteobacteria bacterium]|nr:DUF4209 domain-containing protein [Deltaproteobacteria bacterium]